MKKSTALALLAALLTLASCQVTTLGPPSATGDRQVDVGVGRSIWSGERRIEVEEITEVGPGNSAVVWSLRASASDYQFPKDGIKFDYPPSVPMPGGCTSTPDPNEAFALGECKELADGRLFKCPRLETRKPLPSGACFKYTVTLEPRKGVAGVPPKDPWVKNQ